MNSRPATSRTVLSIVHIRPCFNNDGFADSKICSALREAYGTPLFLFFGAVIRGDSLSRRFDRVQYLMRKSGGRVGEDSDTQDDLS